ncbi:hypothetical protein [Paenibacillus sp. Marseille-Q4541]|uniref:hypothetical protein n=1 Tax=Paenibacillus sp. Marseille-Q4541 TaxID=2831522 RepID=UPI001BA6EA72|nr:hypothetical protein [Paenibacillus sp. Marseille-Q4541]
MSQILILSNNNSHQDYGHSLLKMVKALEESFHTFTDNNFRSNDDRSFLTGQVSYVLENLNKDSIEIADKVYAKLMSETTAYYENHLKIEK